MRASHHAAKRAVAAQLFRAGDAHLQRAANFAVAFHVVRADRLFKPQQIVFHQALADGNGAAAFIRTVGIHRQQNFVTDGFTHRSDVLDIVIGAEAHFHFHRLKARVGVTLGVRRECRRVIRHIAAEKPLAYACTSLRNAPPSSVCIGSFSA